MTDLADRTETADPPPKRDRTHWLYIAVIVAVVAARSIHNRGHERIPSGSSSSASVRMVYPHVTQVTL